MFFNMSIWYFNHFSIVVHLLFPISHCYNTTSNTLEYKSLSGFPGGSVVRNPPANAGDIGDVGSVTRLWRSPGGDNGYPLQYSSQDNPINGGTWWLQSMWLQRVGHNWAPTHAGKTEVLSILILMAITPNPINRNVLNFMVPLTQKSS